MADWVQENGLKLNEAKTQMLLLSRKRRAKELDDVVVKLRGQRVARSDKVKYLGVWVDEGLTWKDHIDAVRRKCCWGLAKLRRLRDSLPAATKKKVYNACVLPHLDYCAVVWQECAKALQKSVERIQNYAMRLICSKPPRTPSVELRGKLGWMTLTKRREMFRLNLVHRCLNSLAPVYLMENFESNELFGQRITRGIRKLHLRGVTTEIGKNATSFKGSQHWNTLPEELRAIRTPATFREHLKEHLLSV